MTYEEETDILNEIVVLIKDFHEGELSDEDALNKLNELRERMEMDPFEELPHSWILGREKYGS